MTRDSTDALPSTQKTGFTDSTQSTRSSASSRYGLNEADASPILVYQYRGDVDVIPQKELADMVNRDLSKRVTRKHIPRGTSSLDLYGYDLCLPEEKDSFKHRAAYWVNLASVPIPRSIYWQHLITGSYDQLYIVSPQSSPENSIYEGDSRKVSPSSTWEYRSQEDTSLGATKASHRLL
ncbi:hypothetical protein AMS68_005300 [Peltaster fructicola]|uniref:Uncharacterized protein n=1 Tax=Peltaster fructicola TaxID=286661 RepID=A0A6H0XYE8_9PEZI|nr:hypothetical protein AMS68_005300 [Peltaster fructicola]